MATVIAIINGTGEWSNKAYTASMAHSFCSQIHAVMGAFSFYQRGPSNDGLSVRSKAKAAAEWLVRAHTTNPAAKICLAGYSRGGSAAVYAAEFLEEKKIDVEALFLFDAVARHIYPGGEVIPANVAFAYHARRSQEASFVAKYEGRIGGGFGNPTRPSFGNTATTFRGAVKYEERIFLGTHGALGGVGWNGVEEDVPCQKDVADWMNVRLLKHGLPGPLVSWPPEGTLNPEPPDSGNFPPFYGFTNLPIA